MQTNMLVLRVYLEEERDRSVRYVDSVEKEFLAVEIKICYFPVLYFELILFTMQCSFAVHTEF